MALKVHEKDEEISKIAEQLFNDDSDSKEKKKESQKESKKDSDKKEEKKESHEEKLEKTIASHNKEKKHNPAKKEEIRTWVMAGVIFVLLIFFFWNPLYIYFPWNHGTITELAENIIYNEGYVKADELPPATPQQQEDAPEAEPEAEPEDTPPPTEDTPTEELPDGTVRGEKATFDGVEIEVLEVDTSVVSEDGSSYGSIDEIRFTIIAESREKIKPKIKYYAWTDEEPERENKPLVNKFYAILEAGDFSTHTELLGQAGSFINYSGTIHTKLELYDMDQNGDTLVGTLVNDISIE